MAQSTKQLMGDRDEQEVRTASEQPVTHVRLNRFVKLNELVRAATPPSRPEPDPVPVRVRHLD